MKVETSGRINGGDRVRVSSKEFDIVPKMASVTRDTHSIAQKKKFELKRFRYSNGSVNKKLESRLLRLILPQPTVYLISKLRSLPSLLTVFRSQSNNCN